MNKPDTQHSVDKSNPSLSFQLLSRGVLRSLLVAALLCSASYYHVTAILEQGLKAQLEKYIAERGVRDSQEFVQAELHHHAFEKAFLLQLNQLDAKAGAERFRDYFEQWPDGTWRTAKHWFSGHVYQDGLFHGGFTGFIGRDVELTEALRNRVAIMAGLLEWYGTVWTATGQYVNYFVTAPENILIGEFVDFPYLHQVSSDIYFPDEIFVAPANEKNNPDRKTVWTRFYFDETAKVWLVSSLHPIYHNEQLVATAGQDILLDDFMTRVIGDRLEGSQNIAFDRQGALLAYEPLQERLLATTSGLSMQELDASLQTVYQAVVKAPIGSGVLELPDRFLAYTQIRGPDWYLVSIYPKSLLQQHGANAALVILAIALLGLLLEFFVLWALVRTYVLKPLDGFLQKTRRLGAGVFSATENLRDGKTCREFDQLGQSFHAISEELRHSVTAQQEANDNLERKVAERTEALALANDKLQQLAITDELTGLKNRRCFQQTIERELDRCHRLKHSKLWVSLTIIDVDHFKQFNDRYGHQFGDKVLAMVGNLIAQHYKRATEWCFRIGGEEFALFMVFDELQVDKLINEHLSLLNAIRNKPLDDLLANGADKLTVSFGAAITKIEPNTHLHVLYQIADKALYRAKSAGRNQGYLTLLLESGEEVGHTIVE